MIPWQWIQSEKYTFYFCQCEVYRIRCTWCLVTTTVSEITASRCTTKIVHIEGSTVPYFDVSGPVTAVFTPMKTHPPGYLAFRHWRVATIQPAGCSSVTPESGRTCGWHSWPGWPFEPEPAGTKSSVAIIVNISVRDLSVSAIETLVILAFWKTKRVNQKLKHENH